MRPDLTDEPRRRFLKQFTVGTCVTTLAGKSFVNRALGELVDEDTSGVIALKLSDYPVLGTTSGSVRLNLHPVLGNGKPGRWYPIIITRATLPSTTFFVLEGRCTHEECTVGWYGQYGNYIECPCHLSRFRRNGTYLSGSATADLATIPYTFDGSTVRVTLAGYYHKVNVTPVPANSTRLQLNFNASRNARHKVLFRAALDVPWTEKLFATTPTGAATQNVFVWEDYNNASPDTKATSLYVDYPGDRGFFAISMQTTVEQS